MKLMKFRGKEKKGMPILLHVTGWIILFILPQLLITGGSFENIRTSLIIFFNTLVFGIIFYVNYLWLVPKFLHNRKRIIYWTGALLIAVIMLMCSSFIFPMLFPDSRMHERRPVREQTGPEPERKGLPFPVRMYFYNFFITSSLVTGFAIALRYSEQSARSESEIKELEKEKLDSELAMLKNQVSPHFFFNTLNNIYSLIEINQKDAQEAVLSLSKMMRYLLYESEHGNTRLSNEIEFMKGYIDLMKLRMSTRVSLRVDFPENYEDMDIPPLLFISFIENAFKHGISYKNNSFIEIALKTDSKRISFITKNSTSKGYSEAPQVDSGIGLENIKKRLALLYPGKHDLRIGEEDSIYTVELVIDTTGS